MPGGHATAVAFVEPAGHQKPGAHAPEHEDDDRPGDEPNTPAGHGVGATLRATQKAPTGHCTGCTDPSGQKKAAGHGPEQAGVVSMAALPKTPAGHSDAVLLAFAQNDPGGHGKADVFVFGGQK